jgi:hypothetical protein
MPSGPLSGLAYATLAQKLAAHARAAVPPARQCRRGVPRELEVVLARLLATDPADRYATPADVAAALVPFTAGADLAQLLAAGGPAVRSAGPELLTAPAAQDYAPGGRHGSMI